MKVRIEFELPGNYEDYSKETVTRLCSRSMNAIGVYDRLISVQVYDEEHPENADWIELSAS